MGTAELFSKVSDNYDLLVGLEISEKMIDAENNHGIPLERVHKALFKKRLGPCLFCCCDGF